jgi:hypothetical protein
MFEPHCPRWKNASSQTDRSIRGLQSQSGRSDEENLEPASFSPYWQLSRLPKYRKYISCHAEGQRYSTESQAVCASVRASKSFSINWQNATANNCYAFFAPHSKRRTRYGDLTMSLSQLLLWREQSSLLPSIPLLNLFIWLPCWRHRTWFVVKNISEISVFSKEYHKPFQPHFHASSQLLQI